MSKITKKQMDILREEIVDFAKMRVFGGFDEWVNMWGKYSNKTENPILDFINLGADGWAGYTYREYVNVARIYSACGFSETVPLDEFYLMFDRLWVTTAVKIVMKEICSSNDELAY